MLSDLFFSRLRDLGARHKTDPLVYLDVWNAESRLNPAATNPFSGAQGLNQMLPKTLTGLGAPAKFAALAAEDQIPWIEKLIVGGEALNGGPFASAERYYHSNFFPRTMSRGQSPTTVVVAAAASDPEERAAYAANKNLDVGNKSFIDYRDLSTFLANARAGNRAVYDRARGNLETPPTAPAASSSSTGAKVVLAGAGLAAAVVGGRALARRYPMQARRRRAAAHAPRRREVTMGHIVVHRSRASAPSDLAVAGGVAAGAVFLVGLMLLVGSHALSKSSPQPPPTPPPTPPPPPPPPPATSWQPATTINPGDQVRASISIPVFLQFAQSLPIRLPSGSAGWASWLQQYGTGITGGTTSQTLSTWGPGDALPTDWPTDDVDEATEYHTEFAYAGAAPVLVSALPIPLRVWVQTKGGGTGGTGPAPLAWHKVGLNGLTPAGHPFYTAMNPGDRVRLALNPASLRQQALAQNFAPDELGLAQLIAKTWLDSTVRFAGTGIVTYTPGAVLPADWPADDAEAATSYHAEFVYHGPITHQRPPDATVWVGTPA